MGHAVGNEVLKETARRISSTLRNSDNSEALVYLADTMQEKLGLAFYFETTQQKKQQ